MLIDRLALIFAFTVHDDIGHKSMDALKEWAMVEVPDRSPEQRKHQEEQNESGAAAATGGY
jgi:hypothetical protein